MEALPVGLFSFAQLCGGKGFFGSDSHAPGYFSLMQLKFHHSNVLGMEGGNTSTEPLNPQNIIGDHSFKQLRKGNKYLYRLLGSKRVDQEHQNVFISEADSHKLLRKHPQSLQSNPLTLLKYSFHMHLVAWFGASMCCIKDTICKNWNE